MKQAVTFRLDPALVAAARNCAKAENRTLTNFIETLLKQHVSLVMQQRPKTLDQPREMISQMNASRGVSVGSSDD